MAGSQGQRGKVRKEGEIKGEEGKRERRKELGGNFWSDQALSNCLDYQLSLFLYILFHSPETRG